VVDATGVFVAEVHSQAGAPSPGRSERTDWGLTWSLRPGSWRVLGLTGDGVRTGHDAGRNGLAAGPGAWTDLSHAVAVLRLEADVAEEVLARICPVDPRRLGPGTASRCSMAQVVTDVVRDDGDRPPYWLLVPRSYARYFLTVVLDAADLPCAT
jgi:heterotetrameric sarcosine oxidase gamma subunit